MKDDPSISPVISDLVGAALRGMEGIRFENLDRCPHCGGKLRGYDFKKKHFACILSEGEPHYIDVAVKRFFCKECGRLSYAHEPFYPGTRIGIPVVDLCISLGSTMPFNRVSGILEQMNVVVDRGTVRNYVKKQCSDERCVNMFGLNLPSSIINLGIKAIQKDGRPMSGNEALIAIGFNPEKLKRSD